MKFFAVAIVADIFFVIEFLTFVLTEDSSNPNFECGNGRTITTTRHNDGINDCRDNSDEFDDPLLISIGCNSDRSSAYNYIMGDFIKSGKVFRTVVSTCEYPRLLMPLESYGPYVYFKCEGQPDQIFRMDRSGSQVENIPLSGKNIQAMTFDQITSNVYVIESGRIKICDKDFRVCSTLPGERPPISLTFSSETGTLSWIEEHQPNSEWRIVTSRRDGTRIRVVVRARTPVTFITVDERRRKFYWLQFKPLESIYSATFTGSSRAERLETNMSLTGVEAFAVNDGLVFWTAKSKADVQSCVIDTNSSSSTVHNSLIGKNIFLYTGERSITPEKLREKQACNETLCSHLCTYVSATDYRCFCDDSDEHLVVRPHNGFCEGSTIVVVRGVYNAHRSNVSFPTISRSAQPFSEVENGSELRMFDGKQVAGDDSYFALGRITLENIDSISAITYDSVQGRLVFAMAGREGIYAYKLGEKEPKLIIPEGDGISSLEFDDWGNNIYWISSTDGTIRVASCSTIKTMIVRRKLPSATPLDFVLATDLGVMFVLLVTTDESINLELYLVSGGRPIDSSQLLHRHNYSDTTYLSLHYMRRKKILLVTDCVKNFTLYIKTEDQMIGRIILIEQFVSLQKSPFWLEADLRLRAYALTQEIYPLNFKIAAVVPAVDSNHSDCRTENGGCQHLCFMSPYSLITMRRHKICQCASAECAEEDDGNVNYTVRSTSSEEDQNENKYITTLRSSTFPRVEKINRRDDSVSASPAEKEKTTKSDHPSTTTVTVTEKTTQNRSYNEDRKTSQTVESSVYDCTLSYHARLFFLLVMILFVIVIVLLIAFIIMLCYVAMSRGNDRYKRESMRMKSFNPLEINYMD